MNSVIMMPTKTPSMNSRFQPGASARKVQPRKAMMAMPKNALIRTLYTMTRRLSNWKSLVALLVFLPIIASAATLLPPGKNCFYDANGASLGAGTVQFYIPNTTTPKDTWKNADQTVLNTNPVLLDSAGCAIIYGSGTYRQVLKDVLGNLIWDQLTADTSGLQISWGGVSTGSGNAQVLPSSGNFSQQSGQVVGFTAGLTNTSATTVSIGGSAIPVVTDTLSGPNSLTAGQITTNNLVAMMYDAVGGKFHVLNTPFPTPYSPPAYVQAQVQLSLSGGNLLLSPFGGNFLTVNGTLRTVPSTGVTLTTSGLSASTTYYIYAFMSSGTLTLAASTTGYTLDSTYGLVVKSDDPTYTLVGMARTTGATAWADSATQRFVLSYYNRRIKGAANNFTTNRSTTSTSYVEVNTEIRVEFLNWFNVDIYASLSGGMQNTGTGSDTYSAVAFDGTTATDIGSYMHNPGGESLIWAPLAGSGWYTGLAEGYHYATLVGKVSANTGTWGGSATAGPPRASLSIGTQG